MRGLCLEQDSSASFLQRCLHLREGLVSSLDMRSDIVSDIVSDIFSDIVSDIVSDIFSDMLETMLSDVLSGKRSSPVTVRVISVPEMWPTV